MGGVRGGGGWMLLSGGADGSSGLWSGSERVKADVRP